MTDSERRQLRQSLQNQWVKTRANYHAAGAPFGPGRGLDVWIEFGQLTTTN